MGDLGDQREGQGRELDPDRSSDDLRCSEVSGDGLQEVPDTSLAELLAELDAQFNEILGNVRDMEAASSKKEASRIDDSKSPNNDSDTPPEAVKQRFFEGEQFEV